MRLTLILLIEVIFLISNIYAKNCELVNNLNHCNPETNIIDNYEPKHFNTTNNLITNGEILDKQDHATPIIILGKLFDTNCVPVPNAEIYAWQVSPKEGKYYYKPLRKFSVEKDMFAQENCENFIGNAFTTTDNEGNFVLITLIPKIGENTTSHGINIRAEHKSLKKTQIRFNFDKQYIALPPIEYLSYDAEDLYKKGNIIYNLKLVMDGQITLKEY